MVPTDGRGCFIKGELVEIQLRKTLIGACSILPWIVACVFALKWFEHMASGTISYGSELDGTVLHGLCVIAFVGFALTMALAVMSFKWNIKIKWQAILFIAGLLSFWSIVGN